MNYLIVQESKSMGSKGGILCTGTIKEGTLSLLGTNTGSYDQF